MSDAADWLPDNEWVVAKDLNIASQAISGNPFVRFHTDTEERKYTSRGMFEQVDDNYVIPEGRELPVELKECDVCEEESWRTGDDECGRCGAPMFDCPGEGCDAEVNGKPDECPECGVGYRWPDEDGENED